MPTTVVLAALVLLQVFSAQEVLGFYGGPTSSAPVLAVSAAEAAVPEVEAEEPVGLPVRIKIPKIRVDAAIGHVGLLPDGSMGIPKRPSEAAWYMLGPKPGEKGSAVIAGHLNWWYGAIGAFARLKTLKPGDRIVVRDDQGDEISFVVRETRTYGQKDDATDVFISNDGKSHLNLVTCSGAWNKLAKQYAKRLVVFADRE